MKTTRADIEFYREMMEHFQAESASKSALVRSLQEEMSALREENTAMRESHREDMDKLRESHREDMDRLRKSHSEDMEKLRKSYEETISAMQVSFEKRLDSMAEANAGLSQQLGDALSAGKLARNKKYGRSSEQRDLLNNRKGTNRNEGEDGTPPPPDAPVTDGTPGTDAEKTMKPSGRRPKEKPEGKARFDEVVRGGGIHPRTYGMPPVSLHALCP